MNMTNPQPICLSQHIISYRMRLSHFNGQIKTPFFFLFVLSMILTPNPIIFRFLSSSYPVIESKSLHLTSPILFSSPLVYRNLSRIEIKKESNPSKEFHVSLFSPRSCWHSLFVLVAFHIDMDALKPGILQNIAKFLTLRWFEKVRF